MNVTPETKRLVMPMSFSQSHHFHQKHQHRKGQEERKHRKGKEKTN